MAVSRAAGAVVAQVGGEAGGHGGWADGSPLPLDEERMGLLFPPHDCERVRLDRAHISVAVTEVAGGSVRWIELLHLP